MKIDMKTVKRRDGWWIIGRETDHGPYDTKVIADEDMKGLARTDRWGDDPGFVTVDIEV